MVEEGVVFLVAVVLVVLEVEVLDLLLLLLVLLVGQQILEAVEVEQMTTQDLSLDLGAVE
jgi:hypothetical protein